MSLLRVSQVSKTYPGGALAAVQKVNLEVERGGTWVLVGASGCGKTTVLRLIAGLEAPDEGLIEIDGKAVAGPSAWVPPERRAVGMVFQDYALFPHLTLARNVGYGLLGLDPAARAARVRDLLELVDLSGLEERFPHTLSGGQQQRAALARALAPRPSLLLLDEPFSNLDASLKGQVREELGRILRQTETTAILVTHDAEEALAAGDRLVVMREGRVVQVGSPREVYAAPADAYVATFFGPTNLLPARAAEGGFETPIGFLPWPAAPAGADVTLSIRPEALHLVSPEAAQLRGHIAQTAYRGAFLELRVAVEGAAAAERELLVRVPADDGLAPGARVGLVVTALAAWKY